MGGGGVVFLGILQCFGGIPQCFEGTRGCLGEIPQWFWWIRECCARRKDGHRGTFILLCCSQAWSCVIHKVYEPQMRVRIGTAAHTCVSDLTK